MVGTDIVLGGLQAVEHELTHGEPSRVSAEQQKRGKIVTAVVRGARRIALHVHDHPGPAAGTAAAAIAGTWLIVSKIRKLDKED